MIYKFKVRTHDEELNRIFHVSIDAGSQFEAQALLFENLDSSRSYSVIDVEAQKQRRLCNCGSGAYPELCISDSEFCG